jgi:hypothetical protein
MIRRPPIPDVLVAIRFTYPTVNQRAATPCPTRILALSVRPRAPAFDLSLLKSKSVNLLRRAVGPMAGMSPHAPLTLNMRRLCRRRTPSHLLQTLTEHRRTTTTCHNHRESHLHLVNTLPEFIIILPKA